MKANSSKQNDKKTIEIKFKKEKKKKKSVINEFPKVHLGTKTSHD